jgi:hypothetical protein
MNSIDGGQITSTVVRSWRAAKDSPTPRSAVEREKWERTIWIFFKKDVTAWLALRGGLREVTDLNVQRTGDDVAYQQVGDDVLPGSASFQHRAVPAVEQGESEDLGPPPPAAAFGTGGLERCFCKIAVRVRVQVESCERHDDVEQLMLDGNEQLAKDVERHDPFVV